MSITPAPHLPVNALVAGNNIDSVLLELGLSSILRLGPVLPVPGQQRLPSPVFGVAQRLLQLGGRGRAGGLQQESGVQLRLLHLARETPLVQLGLEEAGITVELHQVEDLLLGLVEKGAAGLLEGLFGTVAPVRIHVHALGGLHAQVLLVYSLGFGDSFRTSRESTVALACRPEVDVLGAELLLQKFLPKETFVYLNVKLNALKTMLRTKKLDVKIT
jgi:hypothetical protein